MNEVKLVIQAKYKNLKVSRNLLPLFLRLKPENNLEIHVKEEVYNDPIKNEQLLKALNYFFEELILETKTND